MEEVLKWKKQRRRNSKEWSGKREAAKGAQKFKKVEEQITGDFFLKSKLLMQHGCSKIHLQSSSLPSKSSLRFLSRIAKTEIERQIKINRECWVSTRAWPCHPCPFPFHEGIGMRRAVVIPGGKVGPPPLKSQPLASELQPNPGCSTDWSTGSAWHPST